MPTWVPLSKPLGHPWGWGGFRLPRIMRAHVSKNRLWGNATPRRRLGGAGREGGVGRGSCGWAPRGPVRSLICC